MQSRRWMQSALKGRPACLHQDLQEAKPAQSLMCHGSAGKIRLGTPSAQPTKARQTEAPVGIPGDILESGCRLQIGWLKGRVSFHYGTNVFQCIGSC